MEYRNVLSDTEYENQMFKFDLQLFGHHHHGKSGGKIFASIIGAAVGAIWAAPLFSTTALAGGIMGASLFGSIWSATHAQNTSTGSADVSRFDRAQESMSSDGQLPVVYGTRKISGNQTYHQTNADANTLHKHVVLCEGGIDGVLSVMANDYIIPTGNQTGNTVFTLINTKYKDAWAKKSGQTFQLRAGGHYHSIHICNKHEVENSHDTYWEYQVSVTSLITYINQLYGEGWQAFPVAATNSYPGDLQNAAGYCYTNIIPTSYTSTISAIQFKASTIRGGTSYTFHDGTTPSNYNEVGGYPAMAWLDMNFIVSSELNGNPSVSAVVRGKKVYDTRTGKTEFSTNPAMCLRDFMLSKRYGLGRWITEDDLDKDSWNEAADYCDEVISFLDASGSTVRAKRFELNMVIDQKQNAIDWLQEILANFQGFLTLSRGKFKLNIEKKTDISYKFNDDNCSDLSIAPLALNETPNKYVIKIIDPRNNWATVACNVEDFADQKQRQKIITKEVNLNGVTNQYQALRLGRFYRDQNLVCPLNVSFKTGMQGMHLEAGDVVTLSYHGVFKDLPVRITEIKEDEEGKFEITARQYNDTIYGDQLGGGIHWYNYTNTTETYEKKIPSNPTNLTARTEYRRYSDGSTGYDIIVSYDLPSRYDTQTGLVYYKHNYLTAAEIGTFKAGEKLSSVGLSRDWMYAGDGAREIVIHNAKVGDTYQFKVLTRTKDGLVSNDSSAPEFELKVNAKTTVPSQPYNLTYDFSKDFFVSWQDVSDSDFVYYEVRSNANTGSPYGLLAKTQNTKATIKLSDRKGTIYVYAVNSQNKYSYPAKVDYLYPKCDAPTMKFFDTPRGVRIELSAFPAKAKSAVLYIEGQEKISINNNTYTFTGKPDVYKITAAYVDLMGEGYRSAEYGFSVKATFDPSYIEDGSLSRKKMDKVINDAVEAAQNAVPKTEFKQTTDELQGTVADTKKELISQITQNADKITSVITNLNDSTKAKNYSAIAQMQDGIESKVAKDGIISTINQSAEGLTIDGKYVHVTGDTLFENNVITNGMLQAGSVTADKLSANTIALTDNQGIKGGAATLDANGLTVVASNGSKVVHGSNGMEFFNKNGISFSVAGATLTGTAANGKYVRFTDESGNPIPWDNVPVVVTVPQNVQTNHPNYSTSEIRLHCYADEITEEGFRMHAYSGIAHGYGSRSQSQYCGYLSWYAGNHQYVYLGGRNISFNVSMPSNATYVQFHGHIDAYRHYGHGADAYFKMNTGSQHLIIKCNGQQTYSGLFLTQTTYTTSYENRDRETVTKTQTSAEGYVKLDEHWVTTNYVSPKMAVKGGYTLNCTLTLNPWADHPGDGNDLLEMKVYIDSINFWVDGEQILDHNGVGAFFVIDAKNSDLYRIEN